MNWQHSIINSLKQSRRPQTFDQLRKLLAAESRAEIAELYSAIEMMEAGGVLVKNKQGRIGLPEQYGYLTGIVQGHARGFAFVLPEKPGEADVFVPAHQLGSALHGDRVLVQITTGRDNRCRREGRIERILTKRDAKFVGIYEPGRKGGYVVPDDQRLYYDFYIPRKQGLRARRGDKVVARITARPGGRNTPQAVIVEVLGPATAPGIDIISVIRKYGLPVSFPDQVIAETGRLPASVDAGANLSGDRLDLRNRQIVTIDGADAKDLDDAVSLEQRGPGWRLGVHIADVSHYVPEDSALDKEALKRGNSVYLVDRVLPMFPPALSNELCSLNPQADRLTISAFIDLDDKGSVTAAAFQPSIIRSAARLTYDEVQSILDGDSGLRRRYSTLVPMLEDMHRLALLLKEKRLRQGALDFELPEARVVLDEQGRPLAVERRRQRAAESLIEEFMILCNVAVAEYLVRHKLPGLYRTHGHPAPEKLAALRDLLSIFNLSLSGSLESIAPRQVQRLLEDARGRQEEQLVSYLLLRSLPQAVYNPVPEGHFGLALPNYLHFTSPIRRYADLVVHRILKASLAGGLHPNQRRRLVSRLPRIAEQVSATERLAAEAERETVDLKKAEFMEGKEGEIFDGIISGVTSFGLFVELENTVEGLVHISSLGDDYYCFNEKQYALIGERTGRLLRLGAPVKVKLVRVNRSERNIDFELLP